MKHLLILIILLAFVLNVNAQVEISQKDCRLYTSPKATIRDVIERICKHYCYEVDIQEPNEILDRKVWIAFDLVSVEKDMYTLNTILSMREDSINVNYGIVYDRKVVITSINDRKHPSVKIAKWDNSLVLISNDGTIEDILQTCCKHFGYQVVVTGENSNHKIDCTLGVVNLEQDLNYFQRLAAMLPPHLPFKYTIENKTVKVNFE